MRRILSLLFVVLFAIPAAAALLLGPEKGASPVAPGPTPGRDYPLAVATDGTDFLVVWSNDNFDDPATYTAKVTAGGAVTPLPSRRIIGGAIASAQLVWMDDAYLMLWSDPSRGVLAARLDRDGNLLLGPYLLSTRPSAVHALAWNGTNAIALVSDAQSVLAIVLDWRAVFVRESRANGVRIGGDSRLLVAGDGFVAVWAENQRPGSSSVVRAMPISSEGQIGAPLTIATPSAPGVWLDAATDGDRVGVAFTQWPSAPNVPGPMRRLTLDARSFAVTEHASVAASTSPEVVASPDGFVAAVLAPRNGAAILESIPFDSSAARANDVAGTPATRLLTASNGENVLAVWTRGAITGAIFDAEVTEKETDVFTVSTKIIAQGWPQLAPAGDVALLTWIEETPDGGNLMAVRIDRVGHPIGAPVLVGSGEWIGGTHATLFAGNVWLVSWQARGAQSHPQTFLRRVALDGTPLDAAPLDFGVGGLFSFASNGDVVAGVRANAFGVNVHRFSKDGEPLDVQAAIATPEPAIDVDVASNGEDFLVVWLTAEGRTGYDLAAKRFTGSGNFLDATAILIDSAPAAWRPDAIADGEDYLVAYQRDAASILMKRVDRTGVLEGSTAGLPGTVIASGVNPRLVFLGTRLLVSHLSSASGTELQLTDVAAKTTIPVAQSFEWVHHAIASRGEALWLTYARTVPELGGVPRVFVRTVADNVGKRRSARR